MMVFVMLVVVWLWGRAGLVVTCVTRLFMMCLVVVLLVMFVRGLVVLVT
jgi:hypothetical protein